MHSTYLSIMGFAKILPIPGNVPMMEEIVVVIKITPTVLNASACMMNMNYMLQLDTTSVVKGHSVAC